MRMVWLALVMAAGCGGGIDGSECAGTLKQTISVSNLSVRIPDGWQQDFLDQGGFRYVENESGARVHLVALESQATIDGYVQPNDAHVERFVIDGREALRRDYFYDRPACYCVTAPCECAESGTREHHLETYVRDGNLSITVEGSVDDGKGDGAFCRIAAIQASLHFAD